MPWQADACQTKREVLQSVLNFLENKFHSTPARTAIDAQDDTLNTVPEVLNLLNSAVEDQIELGWKDLNKNNLGSRRIAWDVRELLQNTLNDTRSFTGEFNFDNADSDGSQVLTYEIVRVD